MTNVLYGMCCGIYPCTCTIVPLYNCSTHVTCLAPSIDVSSICISWACAAKPVDAYMRACTHTRRYLTLCKYSLWSFRCTELPWGPNPETGMSVHISIHMSIHISETGQLPNHPQSVLTVNAEMACGSTEHRVYQVGRFIMSPIMHIVMAPYSYGPI